MKRGFKRISAAVVAAALIFTTVFTMSVVANAATFTPRLTAPDYSNSYYYSSKNLYYANGWGMPNCTAYAYGRAYEILGKTPNLSRWSAEYWYDDNIEMGAYDYGSTPKLGAIACWYYNGGGGHVAVVEKIENGVITFSNSAWGGSEFYLTTASVNDSNAGGSSWWNFQGYIYVIDGDSYVPETQPVKTYKPGVYQTDVIGVLNMRSGAGTNYDKVTTVPDGVKLNVTEVKANGSNTWGKTTYNKKNGWFALDYCKYISELPVETTAAPTTVKPTTQPTTAAPTTVKPTTQPTTAAPTTVKPTTQPTTAAPTTVKPTTQPTTAAPTTVKPTTQPTTAAPATEPVKSKGLGVGDPNEDGKIDIKDATMIQKIIAQYNGITETQKKYADFNFDGKVNIADVTGLQKYLTYKASR